MSKIEKLLKKILLGKSDNNLSLNDLKTLLIMLGFEKKAGAGSHTIFKKAGILDMINLQSTKDGKAKPYQVKQVREIILKHKLNSDE
jgi:predicted RNA binding protein YcfA (HicA-like mRNA interferase family)